MLSDNPPTTASQGEDFQQIERRLNQWELVEYSPDGLSLEAAEAHFRQAYREFDETAVLDELRVREYARLDRLRQDSVSM